MNRKQRRARGQHWSTTPEFRKYAEEVITGMVPQMEGSAYVISIAPTKGAEDVKIAVEIGFALLLDKPLIVFAPEGRHVAERLLRAADHVITGDVGTEAGRQEMFEKLGRIIQQ